MRRDPGLELWTDGDCALCRRSSRWVELRDERGVILIRDLRSSSDEQLPVDRSTVETAIVARDREGRIYSGFAAWRQVLARVPRWRWLSVALAVPPLSWIGSMLYRIVARNRHRFN